MENLIDLQNGTENGQLKIRVFSFLNRLNASRNAEQEHPQNCVFRVFKCATASSMVQDWISRRKCG